MVNFLAYVILIFIAVALLWASDDDNLCEYAEAEIAAFGMCAMDTMCFTNPDDYANVTFFLEIGKKYCNKEKE